MARLCASILLILIGVSNSYSQKRIQQAEAPQVDPWKASLASLVLPGLGQKIQGDHHAAKWFIISETTFWLGTLSSYSAKEHYLSSALDNAGRYAGATSAPRDEEFLQLIGEYQSRRGSAGHNSSPSLGEDYNQDLIRSGLELDYKYPDTEEYHWDWGSSDQAANNQRRVQYNSLLRRYRLSKIIYQSSIGLLFLNRIVSSIHALRNQPQAKVSTNSQWIIEPLPEIVRLSWVRNF